MGVGVNRVRGDNAVDTTGSAIGYIGKKFMGTHDYSARSPGINTARADQERSLGLQSRGMQSELGAAIQDRALGRGGPSVAQQQLQRGQAQNQLAARSMAASARGGNVALGNRMAAQGQQQAMAQTGEQTAMLRAQEQIAAQQLGSQHAASQRQQDLLARGYSIEEARAAADADLKAQEINARIAEGTAQRGQSPIAMGIGALAALSDVRAKENVTPLYSDFYGKEQVAPAAPNMFAGNVATPAPNAQYLHVAQDQSAAAPGSDAQLQEMKQNRFQAAMQNGGAQGGGDSASSGMLAGLQLGSMLSDFRSKTGVTAAQSREDLRSVNPVTYSYKPEHAARMAVETAATPEQRAMVYADKRAPRLGILAQDLEKSPAFDSSVIETPAGKAVERDRALSTALAELGGLNKRLEAIEKTEYPELRQPGEAAKEKPKARAPKGGSTLPAAKRRDGPISRYLGAPAPAASLADIKGKQFTTFDVTAGRDTEMRNADPPLRNENLPPAPKEEPDNRNDIEKSRDVVSGLGYQTRSRADRPSDIESARPASNRYVYKPDPTHPENQAFYKTAQVERSAGTPEDATRLAVKVLRGQTFPKEVAGHEGIDPTHESFSIRPLSDISPDDVERLIDTPGVKKSDIRKALERLRIEEEYGGSVM